MEVVALLAEGRVVLIQEVHLLSAGVPHIGQPEEVLGLLVVVEVCLSIIVGS